MQSVDVNLTDHIKKTCVVHLRAKGLGLLSFRFRMARLIFQFGAWVAGVGFRLSSEHTDQSQDQMKFAGYQPRHGGLGVPPGEE